MPIIRSWALTRGFALHPGTKNRYEIRYTRTQHRPPSRQVNDHGRVSGTHRSSRDTDSATAPRVAYARAAADPATGFRSASQSGCPPLGSAPTVISSHTRSGIVHTAAHATGYAPGDSAANSVTPRRRTTPDAGRCRPPQSPAGVATDTYIDRMSPASDFPEAVTQDQRLSDFLADDQGPWTTVYQSLWPDEDFGIFSVFASRSRQAEMLSRPEWEMHPCDGRPGFVSDKRGVSRYGRYGRTDKTRPVVVLLSHGGVLPQMLPQVLEEFRHFHNLWEDPAGGVLKKLLADGSEETVCKVTQRHVQIRSSYLRRFQAATQLCLVRFVDSIANTPNHQQWATADLAALDQTVRTDGHMWSRDVRLDIEGRGEVSSRIRAKTAVAPPPRDQCGAWPWDDGSTDAAASHRTFIVAETPTGVPIEHTCDPESTASNFGVSDDLPLGQLTRVFFDRLVLQRYYANPQKYRVASPSDSPTSPTTGSEPCSTRANPTGHSSTPSLPPEIRRASYRTGLERVLYVPRMGFLVSAMLAWCGMGASRQQAVPQGVHPVTHRGLRLR